MSQQRGIPAVARDHPYTRVDEALQNLPGSLQIFMYALFYLRLLATIAILGLVAWTTFSLWHGFSTGSIKAETLNVTISANVTDATIGSLYVTDLVTVTLSAVDGVIEALTSATATITTLTSTTAVIYNTTTTLLTATTAYITEATVTTLTATTATIESAIVTTLAATNATIAYLVAASAEITTLVSTTATIASLTSTNATITTLTVSGTLDTSAAQVRSAPRSIVIGTPVEGVESFPVSPGFGRAIAERRQHKRVRIGRTKKGGHVKRTVLGDLPFYPSPIPGGPTFPPEDAVHVNTFNEALQLLQGKCPH
jgi:hypothetical protein